MTVINHKKQAGEISPTVSDKNTAAHRLAGLVLNGPLEEYQVDLLRTEAFRRSRLVNAAYKIQFPIASEKDHERWHTDERAGRGMTWTGSSRSIKGHSQQGAPAAMSEVNMSSNEGSPKNRIGVEISVVTSQDEEGKPLRVVTWFKPAEHTEWPYTVERDNVQEHFRVEDTNGTAYVYPGRVYLGDEDHVGVPDKYGETYYRLLAELGEHVSPIKEGSNLFKWEDASATAPPPSNIAA